MADVRKSCGRNPEGLGVSDGNLDLCDSPSGAPVDYEGDQGPIAQNYYYIPHGNAFACTLWLISDGSL
jgi:hypothetical protein